MCFLFCYNTRCMYQCLPFVHSTYIFYRITIRWREKESWFLPIPVQDWVAISCDMSILGRSWCVFLQLYLLSMFYNFIIIMCVYSEFVLSFDSSKRFWIRVCSVILKRYLVPPIMTSRNRYELGQPRQWEGLQAPWEGQAVLGRLFRRVRGSEHRPEHRFRRRCRGSPFVPLLYFEFSNQSMCVVFLFFHNA